MSAVPISYRTIHVDGRMHPKDLSPSYYGHSIGRWEGDTLVVDTRGFNEGFWFDRSGLPHTEQLHMIERFTRTDSKTMQYRVTIEDPGAYTQAWSSSFDMGWDGEQELFEYICQENNLAADLLVGSQEQVDRQRRNRSMRKGRLDRIRGQIRSGPDLLPRRVSVSCVRFRAPYRDRGLRLETRKYSRSRNSRRRAT